MWRDNQCRNPDNQIWHIFSGNTSDNKNSCVFLHQLPALPVVPVTLNILNIPQTCWQGSAQPTSAIILTRISHNNTNFSYSTALFFTASLLLLPAFPAVPVTLNILNILSSHSHTFIESCLTGFQDSQVNNPCLFSRLLCTEPPLSRS